MSIRAIVFDIGGVLEITPRTGWDQAWDARLGLEPGGLSRRLGDVWRGGELGTLSLAGVEHAIGTRLGLNRSTVAELMAEIWSEDLGTLTDALAAYFAGLRPRFTTALLRNSFVGAREREQARYHFADSCDVLLYSHELGLAKPDPRLYVLVCERLGVPPSEIIFLDDSQVCVDPACALGIHGMLDRDTAQAIADIEACVRANAGP